MSDPAPDFSFDPAQDPARELLAPLFRHILTAGPAPIVSLGAIQRDAAETWLRHQHDRYREGLGQRSYLIMNMDLVARVTLVGLAE